jgi:HSP20 family protein
MKKIVAIITALIVGSSLFATDTNLTKPYDPFKEMHNIQQYMLKMHEEMDKMFSDFHQKMRMDNHFGDFEPFKHNLFDMKPAVDLEDKGDFYEIKANIPGADNQNINVTTKDGMLKIEANTQRSNSEKGDKFLKQERYMGSYTRILSLPNDIDESSLKTNYKDGVLTVTISKKGKKV